MICTSRHGLDPALELLEYRGFAIADAARLRESAPRSAAMAIRRANGRRSESRSQPMSGVDGAVRESRESERRGSPDERARSPDPYLHRLPSPSVVHRISHFKTSDGRIFCTFRPVPIGDAKAEEGPFEDRDSRQKIRKIAV